MSGKIKSLLIKIFDFFGFEIHRRRPLSHSHNTQTPLDNLLSRIKGLGFEPKTIFDVGVATGTEGLYQTFPDARFILIEPLEECLPYLQALTKTLQNSEYILAAASCSPGTTTINVHPDLFGSSLYKEDEDSEVNGLEREVPTVTLDGISREKGVSGPYLIKIDTQGSELDVLKGAEEILPETELIILEVSLFEFFKGGPQFYDVVSFMKEHGFVVYDIQHLQHRLLDGAMSQADLVFVKENGMFRMEHRYATREQRSEQTRAFIETLVS